MARVRARKKTETQETNVVETSTEVSNDEITTEVQEVSEDMEDEVKDEITIETSPDTTESQDDATLVGSEDLKEEPAKTVTPKASKSIDTTTKSTDTSDKVIEVGDKFINSYINEYINAKEQNEPIKKVATILGNIISYILRKPTSDNLERVRLFFVEYKNTLMSEEYVLQGVTHLDFRLRAKVETCYTMFRILTTTKSPINGAVVRKILQNEDIITWFIKKGISFSSK
jgi:hypothetical protein